MTGFRVALGGACELYRLDPDLVTLGKIVGGGLPVGVFGGKRKYMDMLAPLGPVYQAGTLSGNPLAMAAGIATIGYLQEHRGRGVSAAGGDGEGGRRGRCGRGGEGRRGADARIAWARCGRGSLRGPGDELRRCARSRIRRRSGSFIGRCWTAGVWLPPSQFEAAFLGTAHGEAEVRATIEAAREAFRCGLVQRSGFIRATASSVTNLCVLA